MHGLLLNFLFVGHAFGGPIANVKFIHDYIDAKHNVSVSVASGQSVTQAANMQYLLKSIDVANEILNGCPVSDYYGNSVYSTTQAVDTNASIQGIDTLIKYYPPSLLDLDNEVTHVPIFDGNCASAAVCATGNGTVYDSDSRTCVNDKWTMLCNISGYTSYDENMFVTFPYSNPTKMSLDGLSWSDFKNQAFGPHGQWAFSNLKGPTDTIWIMTHDATGTKQYQYYRSGTPGNFVSAYFDSSDKWTEHIKISSSQIAVFGYQNKNIALMSYTASGEPSYTISQVTETTLNTHSGEKLFDCDPNGYCLMITQRCTNFPTGLAYRFPFSDLSTGQNFTPARDLQNLANGSDMTTILEGRGRYRFVRFCNGKFLVVPDGGLTAALSTDATGEFWQAVALPNDPDRVVATTALSGCNDAHLFAGFNMIGCYDNKFFIGGPNMKTIYYSDDPLNNGWTAMNLPGAFSGRQKFDFFNNFVLVSGGFGTDKMFVYNPVTPCVPAPGYIRNSVLNTCDTKFYDKTYFYNNDDDYCAGICWNKAYVAGSSAENFDLTDCTKKACIPACIVDALGMR